MGNLNLRREFEKVEYLIKQMTKEIKKWWEKNSKYYQNKYKLPVEIHYGPGVFNEDKLKLLGKLKDKKILELGCGGGQCSIAFAKKGAKVIGIDISEEQLKFAQKLAEKNKVKINFIKSSFQNLKGIKSNSQDLVFSAWAFQYSPNLKKVFKKVHSFLKKGGLFVFCIEHPFLHCVNHNATKIKKNYFKLRKLVEGEFVEYQRKISEIYNPLRESDFDILEILEPYSGNKNVWKDKEHYGKRRISRIPSTIIFKARKIKGKNKK